MNFLLFCLKLYSCNYIFQVPAPFVAKTEISERPYRPSLLI